MTVAELIAMLNRVDQKAKVHFAYPLGDYARSEAAQSVSQVDVVDSSSFHMGPQPDVAILYEDSTIGEMSIGEEVVVLR